MKNKHNPLKLYIKHNITEDILKQKLNNTFLFTWPYKIHLKDHDFPSQSKHLNEMELLQNYASEESFTEERSQENLSPRKVRSVYLITYSQADLEKFPTRQLFAETVSELFQSGTVKVIQWVCSMENHELTRGVHYHLAVKLSMNKRWLLVKNAMSRNHGIQLNFSANHENYFSAWQYVTKEDQQYAQSPNHPDLTLTECPQTTQATKSRKRKKGQTKKTKKQNPKKKKRLTPSEVSDIIVNKNIKSKTELYALVKTQKQEGRNELHDFVINRNSKKISELISTSWEIENAHRELARQNQKRTDILGECLSGDCVDSCDGMWYETAINTLHRNNINAQAFTGAIKTLLEKGRGKYCNILIVGPANCGKTFILKPLVSIFETFVNPATSSFAWVGAEKAEVIFLNDFRWSSQLIPWHDLLLLLEGEKVHLPAPKTHFVQDILLDQDTPIFATSSNEIEFVKNGVTVERETNMMRVRWRVFEFINPVPESEQRELKPCPHCFARLVFH